MGQFQTGTPAGRYKRKEKEREKNAKLADTSEGYNPFIYYRKIIFNIYIDFRRGDRVAGVNQVSSPGARHQKQKDGDCRGGENSAVEGD